MPVKFLPPKFPHDIFLIPESCHAPGVSCPLFHSHQILSSVSLFYHSLHHDSCVMFYQAGPFLFAPQAVSRGSGRFPGEFLMIPS